MKLSQHIEFFIFSSLLGIHLGSTAFAAVSLKDAYQSALEKTEAVGIQDARVEQSRERLSQTEGALYPALNFVGNYQRQDTPPTITTAVTRPEQSTLRLALTQPLFRGLREFSELRAANKTFQSSELESKSLKLNLYNNVSAAYFNALAAEKDLNDLDNLRDLTAKRVQELKERVKIGRSRNGELLSALAQLAQLKAQVEGSRRELAQSRETLVQVTGLSRDVELKENETELPPPPPVLESLLQRVEERPDIQARKLLAAVADERVTTAFGGHLPTLDLSGNYYFKRTGFLEDVKWDIGLQLTVPLFQGGVIQSQVREATAARKEQELALGTARREAIRQIRSQYETLQRLRAEHGLFDEAVRAAEQNYQEQNRDYRYGLVTNLDVLQALNTLQETRRLLARTYYSAKTAHSGLQAATGLLP